MPSSKSFPRPKRWSESSRIEERAVTDLSRAFLDNPRLRPFFLHNDKTPNHDGYFLLDEPALPCGLLVVQIRGTDAAFLKRHKVHVDLHFCAFCHEAVLAGVFFYVSLQVKRARWVAIGPRTLLAFKAALKPTVSPLIIPLLYCHINGFQRAFSAEKPLPGGENRMAGWAAHPVEW